MTEPLPEVNALRILTLNVWARGGNWPERREVLVAGLRELRPDLVAFQETIAVDGYDQAEDLLGDEFEIVQQRTRDLKGMGISIASRWPIARATEIDLHLTARTGEFPCATLAAEIELPTLDTPLLFVNHFPSWQPNFEHERELQAVAAAELVNELVGSREMHVVVAGDFDADPEAASIRFWTGRQALNGVSVCYLDAWQTANGGARGETFSASNPLVAEHAEDWPFRRTDYVFVRFSNGRTALRVATCQLAFDQPVDGVWASDHFAVVADLELRA